MNSRAFRAGSDASVVATIIAGEPWTAAAIRNPHFRRSCRALNRTFHNRNPLAELIAPWCQKLIPLVAERSRLLSEAHALQNQIVPALVRVSSNTHSWLRDPKDWWPSPGDEPIAQWRSLLRHLFAEWPIPFFLDSVWLLPGGIFRPERMWYLHLGKGGSWRSAEKMPQAITRRALHHAMQAPDDLDAYQALRWGQLRSLGAGEYLISEVLQSRMVRDLEHEELWSRLLEKVAADQSFDHRDFGVIADVIRGLLARHRTNHADSVVNLPLPELKLYCHRHWQRILGQARAMGIRFRHDDVRHPGLRGELYHIAGATWVPMDDVNPFEIQRRSPAGTPSRWTISEHCSHAWLARDGKVLRHCVGVYWRRCFAGDSAIFSLCQYPLAWDSSKMITRVTIEVDPHSRRIVQARGKWNRPPDRFERDLIRIWAGQNQLKMAV